jgi:hypothetical protein
VTDESHIEATGGPDKVPAGRQLFRFLVGLSTVAPERLALAFKLAGELGPPTPTAPLPAAPRHVLIGAMSLLPTWLGQAWARADPAARRWGGRAARLSSHLLPGPLAAPLRNLREAVTANAAAWAEIGRREEQAGRHLVQQSAQVLPDSILSRVAESSDLRKVMAEQTAGFTRTAVDRLRQTSARADDAGESVILRVFRRRGPGSEGH